eukprot:5497357-Alexandrium_andersonii.AAC.1
MCIRDSPRRSPTPGAHAGSAHRRPCAAGPRSSGGRAPPGADAPPLRAPSGGGSRARSGSANPYMGGSPQG